MTNISVCEWIWTYDIFYLLLLTCTVSQESHQEGEKIHEEPSVEDAVAVEKTTDDPVPFIDPIFPITGKYFWNRRYYY